MEKRQEQINTLRSLEKKLGYTFNNIDNLLTALTHRSFAFEKGVGRCSDNEVLEFVGDAALDLVISAGLVRRYPQMQEGELTKLRASLVKASHLATMAKLLNLGDFLLLGKGEERSKGRKKTSILSCAYEAVVGAIFQDGGYMAVQAFVQQQFEPWYDKQLQAVVADDAKSRLQEICQEHYNQTPTYTVEKEAGPDHNKSFTVAVFFMGEKMASGTAGSKKMAEQQAASKAIERFAHFNF